MANKSRETANLLSNVGVSTIRTEVNIINGPVVIGSAVTITAGGIVAGLSTVNSINATHINATGVGTFTGAIVGSAVTITSGGIVAGLSTITNFRATHINISGVTTVAAGSTAAPSITPTGDTDTGIFFPSADTIAFAEGGSEALRIDSSGNIGIGITNPSSQLHITGQFQSTQANSTTTGGGQIYLNGATGNRIDFNQAGVAAPAFTTRSVGTKIVLYPAINASNVDYALGIDSSTLWYSVPETTTHQFKWYAGTTNIATLFGTGELVVGTTSKTGTASQTLQVTGGAYVSGNIGIGTINPSNKISVVGSIESSGGLLLTPGSATTPSIRRVDDTNTGLYFPAPDEIALSAGGSEVLYSSGGNIRFNSAQAIFIESFSFTMDNTYKVLTPWSTIGNRSGGASFLVILNNHTGVTGGNRGLFHCYVHYNGTLGALYTVLSGLSLALRVNAGNLEAQAFDGGTGLPTTGNICFIFQDHRMHIT